VVKILPLNVIWNGILKDLVIENIRLLSKEKSGPVPATHISFLEIKGLVST
jgi:hypothetical protein